MLGRKIHNYQVEELLGEGGMGAVYKATDTSLERTVAIKALHTHLTNDPIFLERFKNEAKLAAKLSHPNLALVYNFIQEDNEYFIVMEYIQGLPLDEYLKKNKSIQAIESIQIISQVLNGLGHAHQKNILHRDIKPGNIMILPDHTIKLMDFGIAKIKGGTKITGIGKIIGTMEYMSPELLQGSEASIQSDLYAVGITFFEMLTGKMPFHANSESQLLHEIIHKKIQLPDSNIHNFPDELNLILESMLHKNPIKRPNNAKELQDKLYKVLSTESNNKSVTNLSLDTLKLPKVNLNFLEYFTNIFSNNSSLRLLGVLGIFAILIFAGIEIYFNSINNDPLRPNPTSQSRLNTNNTIIQHNSQDINSDVTTMQSTQPNTNLSTQGHVPKNEESPLQAKKEKANNTPSTNDPNKYSKSNVPQTKEPQSPNKTTSEFNNTQPNNSSPSNVEKTTIVAETNKIPSNSEPTKSKNEAKTKLLRIPSLDVRLRLAETISSNDLKKEGDIVKLEVISDVFVNSDLIIAQGSEALARISKIKPSGSSSSFLEIQIEKVKSINGAWLNLKMIPLGMKGSKHEPVIFNKGVNVSPNPKLIPQNINL